MPSEGLKSAGGWQLDGVDGQDQQLSNYYNAAAASQYNQPYHFYNPTTFYRYPYLPTNPGAIYRPTYANGFDYPGYPSAYGVQYYNKSMGAVGTSPISSTSFQQYTNNLVSTNNFNSSTTSATPMINSMAIKSDSPSPSASYYNCTTPKVESKPKKSKRRKTANANGKQEVTYKRVYVWELDELYADAPHFLSEPAMQSLIGQILSDRFQLTSTEEFDYANIEDANIDESMAEHHLSAAYSNVTSETFGGLDEKPNELQQSLVGMNPLGSTSAALNGNTLDNMKRNAASQQRIKDVYLANQFDFENLIKNLDLNLYHVVEQQRRQYATSKPQPYARCMKLIAERSAAAPEAQQANVVICQEPLPFALAKLLIQGVAAHVPPENVYSSMRNEFSNALERIIPRFKREKLVVISGRAETVQAAKNLNIPVWQVHQPKDVETFYIALDRYLR